MNTKKRPTQTVIGRLLMSTIAFGILIAWLAVPVFPVGAAECVDVLDTHNDDTVIVVSACGMKNHVTDENPWDISYLSMLGHNGSGETRIVHAVRVYLFRPERDFVTHQHQLDRITLNAITDGEYTEIPLSEFNPQVIGQNVVVQLVFAVPNAMITEHMMNRRDIIATVDPFGYSIIIKSRDWLPAITRFLDILAERDAN